MMTAMMSTFKDKLLQVMSSLSLEMVTTVMYERQRLSNVVCVVYDYLTAELNDSSVFWFFADLVAEFTTADKTGPAIDKKLAGLADLCKA